MFDHKNLIAALLMSTALTTTAYGDGDHANDPARNELFKPGVDHASGAPATIGDRPPLIEGLGDFGMEITASQDAQAYFDQGLGWLWGFNHAEAVRAFRAAQDADPACAMCYWGEAYALGPNLNMPMLPDQIEPAWAALEKAVELGGATPKEQAMISALATRYAPDGGDRAALDRAFADAMAAAAADWPADANIQTIHADALMNLQPWDYWEADGVTPKGEGAAILAALETAIEVASGHPAALHLYIHAVEASSDPARAEAAADALRGSTPAAGHLVHMPAHIYNRVGRFEDSIATNQAAIAADEAFIEQAGAAASPLYRYGYYPHNVHFLLVAAQNAGVKDVALDAADKLAQVTSPDMAAELAWVQAILTAPYTAHAQFTDPEAILALDPPQDDFPFVKGFYHYARGLAHVGLGDLDSARQEVAEIKALIDGADFTLLVEQYLPAIDVLGIAKQTVEGRIEAAAGNYDAAIHHLREAIALEEAIPYMEPPYWYYPIEQTLGAVLLAAERPREAADAFEAALAKAPNSGWSLWGLLQAREAELGPNPDQADEFELAKLRAKLAKSWLGPDDLLSRGRL